MLNLPEIQKLVAGAQETLSRLAEEVACPQGNLDDLDETIRMLERSQVLVTESGNFLNNPNPELFELSGHMKRVLRPINGGQLFQYGTLRALVYGTIILYKYLHLDGHYTYWALHQGYLNSKMVLTEGMIGPFDRYH